MTDYFVEPLRYECRCVSRQPELVVVYSLFYFVYALNSVCSDMLQTIPYGKPSDLIY